MQKYLLAVRDFVSEWTVTILILLFGTTTLMQAFVVP
ncbi:MAG: signal peptidase I, partial [Acidobacteria bacterium]|nr:signal peptidase I [Acidobacteriota bacterium]